MISVKEFIGLLENLEPDFPVILETPSGFHEIATIAQGAYTTDEGVLSLYLLVSAEFPPSYIDNIPTEV